MGTYTYMHTYSCTFAYSPHFPHRLPRTLTQTHRHSHTYPHTLIPLLPTLYMILNYNCVMEIKKYHMPCKFSSTYSAPKTRSNEMHTNAICVTQHTQNTTSHVLALKSTHELYVFSLLSYKDLWTPVCISQSHVWPLAAMLRAAQPQMATLPSELWFCWLYGGRESWCLLLMPQICPLTWRCCHHPLLTHRQGVPMHVTIAGV